MANQSSFICNVVNVRAAGSKDPITGITAGGIYFPNHTTREGKQISAHWEGTFYINQLGWTDPEGTQHDPKNIPIRITAWNGRNAGAGKGLADIFAKCVSTGKELCAALRLDFYEKRLYINGVPQVDQNGQPIKYPAYGWLIKSDLQWGSDSSSVIAQEIANWANQANFFSRPPLWNVQNTPDNEAWKTVVAQRMATIYQGEPTYGYARVMIPEGATPIYDNRPPSSKPETVPFTGPSNPLTMPGMSPSGMVMPPLPPNTGIPSPPQPAPSGPNYEQLKQAGWTDEQIKADQRFTHLAKPQQQTGTTYEQLKQAGWNDEQIKADQRFAHLAKPQTGAMPTSAANLMAPGASPMTNNTGL